jgi:hypothetical protein
LSGFKKEHVATNLAVNVERVEEIRKIENFRAEKRGRQFGSERICKRHLDVAKQPSEGNR